MGGGGSSSIGFVYYDENRTFQIISKISQILNCSDAHFQIPLKRVMRTYNRFRAFWSSGDRRRWRLVFLFRTGRACIRWRAARATATDPITLPFLRKYLDDGGTTATRKSVKDSPAQ